MADSTDHGHKSRRYIYSTSSSKLSVNAAMNSKQAMLKYLRGTDEPKTP